VSKASEVKRFYKIHIILFAAVFIAAVVWFYDFGPAPAQEPETVGVPMGDFMTLDIFGNEVESAIFADYELTMFYVWTTY